MYCSKNRSIGAGLCLLALPLLALLIVPDARAIVIIPHTYHVGVTGVGSSCNFSTIQLAIGACATSGDTIIIDGGQTYSAQHLLIENKSITIGVGPCQAVIGGGSPSTPAANAQVTLNGNIGASTAVFTITGTSNVTLVDLQITGNQSSGNGGGIEYTGVGTLTLNNVLVFANTAANGGGIDFNGSGTLMFGPDTAVESNTATSGDGGGVRIVGASSTLQIGSSGNDVFNNHAPNGFGGGIAVIGALANLDSQFGAADLLLVQSNSAKDGGGIAVLASATSDANVQASTNDPSQVVFIQSNRATENGGGIYLRPDGPTSHHATFFSYGASIDYNYAVEGSAIYGACAMSQSACDVISFISESGYFDGPNRNTIDHNVAEDEQHNPTAGSTIWSQNAYLDLGRSQMLGNVGAHVVGSIGSPSLTSPMYLSECLLAENQLSGELLVSLGQRFYIDQCTFANDAISAAQVIRTNYDVFFTNSILGEDVAALDQTGGTLTAHNIVAANTGGLPGAADIVQADPLFFDITQSDYRLRVQTDGVTVTASPAVDFAAATAENDYDLAGRPRDLDVTQVTDKLGVRDLGAYEMQPITDRVFTSGFGDPVMLVY